MHPCCRRAARVGEGDDRISTWVCEQPLREIQDAKACCGGCITRSEMGLERLQGTGHQTRFKSSTTRRTHLIHWTELYEVCSAKRHLGLALGLWGML